MKAIPDLSDDAEMAKRGRLYTLKNARADAMHELRDVASRLLSQAHDDAPLIASARELLDRIELIGRMEEEIRKLPPPQNIATLTALRRSAA